MLFYEWKRLNPPDPALTRVANQKTLIFGINPDFPPFATISNDQVVGLDADIAREIAHRMGVDVKFRVLGFDGLYDALRVGEADLLISGLVFDPARLGDVLFSVPYFDGGAVLVSVQGISDMPAMDGRRVGVEVGSSGDDVARLWTRRLHQLDVKQYPGSGEALDGLANNQVDAVLLDQVTARLYLKTHPALKMSDPVQTAPYVIAARRSSAVVLDRVNRALQSMVADGTLAALLDRWL